MRLWFFSFFLFIFPWKAFCLEISFAGKSARGEVVARQGNDLIMAGTVSRGARQALGLIRLNEKEGIVFKKTHSFDGKVFVHGLVVRPNGKIVVGGFLKKKCCGDFWIAQFNPDGSLDEAYTDDFGRNDEIHYLALQPDGKIVAAGFRETETGHDFVIARYLPDGKPDRGFGDRGKVIGDFTPDDRIFGVALQKDGKIVVVGSIYRPETSDNCAVVRYDGNGNLDKNFGDGGLTILDSGPLQDACSSVAVAPDGTLVAAGFSTQKNRDTDFFLARLASDGTILSSTKTDFRGGLDVAHAVEILPGGKIVLGGEYGFERRGKTHSGFALAVYTPQGFQKGIQEIDFKQSATAQGMTFVSRKIVLVGQAGPKIALQILPLNSKAP